MEYPASHRRAVGGCTVPRHSLRDSRPPLGLRPRDGILSLLIDREPHVGSQSIRASKRLVGLLIQSTKQTTLGLLFVAEIVSLHYLIDIFADRYTRVSAHSGVASIDATAAFFGSIPTVIVQPCTHCRHGQPEQNHNRRSKMCSDDYGLEKLSHGETAEYNLDWKRN